MQVTNEMLARFVGGQMEVQNQGKYDEPFLYRGEIESIGVRFNMLETRFKWLAKGEGFPPLPLRWVNDEKLEFSISLELYTASEMNNGRLSFRCEILGELVVLYPTDGSRLDPTKVEGLVLQ